MSIEWQDDQIYDNLCATEQEQLVSTMIAAVEENPNITLLEFLKQYENEES